MTVDEYFRELERLDGKTLNTLHRESAFRVVRSRNGEMAYVPSSGKERRPSKKAVEALLAQFFAATPRVWNPGHYGGTRNASYFLAVMKHLGY
jgi:hypothetical protein